jgi:ribosome-associated protein
VDEFTPDALPLSRTKKKQWAKQVEQLAEHLASLADNQFSQLDLPPEIAREAELARLTKGRSSQRRQLKRLAGLLRKTEDALASLLVQLQDLDQVARGRKKQFHQLEQLRDRLCDLDSFADAFSELLELAPAIDRKAIARLARSVHQYDDRRAYREIFRRLRDELSHSC